MAPVTSSGKGYSQWDRAYKDAWQRRIKCPQGSARTQANGRLGAAAAHSGWGARRHRSGSPAGGRLLQCTGSRLWLPRLQGARTGGQHGLDSALSIIHLQERLQPCSSCCTLYVRGRSGQSQQSQQAPCCCYRRRRRGAHPSIQPPPPSPPGTQRRRLRQLWDRRLPGQRELQRAGRAEERQQVLRRRPQLQLRRRRLLRAQLQQCMLWWRRRRRQHLHDIHCNADNYCQGITRR